MQRHAEKFQTETTRKTNRKIDYVSSRLVEELFLSSTRDSLFSIGSDDVTAPIAHDEMQQPTVVLSSPINLCEYTTRSLFENEIQSMTLRQRWSTTADVLGKTERTTPTLC